MAEKIFKISSQQTVNRQLRTKMVQFSGVYVGIFTLVEKPTNLLRKVRGWSWDYLEGIEC
ncbi:hypothetical protein [Vibrio fluminensis]|uniref:hypothetical protein n=1 Tax=Vibrio fluminensis TaxID=2783614 RepID=UPI001887FF2D|nr:hypothetical protein [Vibrio fluminensis]